MPHHRYESTIVAVFDITGEWEVRFNGWDDVWNRRVKRYSHDDVAVLHSYTTCATPQPAHLNGIQRHEGPIDITVALVGARSVAHGGMTDVEQLLARYRLPAAPAATAIAIAIPAVPANDPNAPTQRQIDNANMYSPSSDKDD